jgi:outer membrane protein OmpA-like peptidoglycan-associated protein
MLNINWTIVLIMLGINSALAASDLKGSHDHPLISRFPSSVIKQQVKADFDEYTISLVAPKGKKSTFAEVKKLTVAGRLLRTGYELPKTSSPLAVFRSYEQALQNGGFTTLFSCQKNECGSIKYWEPLYLGVPGASDSMQFYLAAKKTAEHGNRYVVLHVSQNGEGGFIVAQVDVVEETSLQQDLVTTSVEDLKKSFSSFGKAVVYDIYFDSGKSEVKIESEPALTAIADYLKASKAKLFVVGHTDLLGSWLSNLELSKLRANAIVANLLTKGVDANQLLAQGVGPLSPAANNNDETGRMKNRRVELVPMQI